MTTTHPEGDFRLKSPDASRMGKASEHLVAASSILMSRGRLNVSMSLVDDEVVDLVFFERGRTATLAVQVKARMSTSKALAERSSFGAVVREATFAARADLDMLFVAVDVDGGRIQTAWLVPSEDFARRAVLRSNQTRRFVASTKPNSHDQWVAYRHDARGLVQELLARLEHLDTVRV